MLFFSKAKSMVDATMDEIHRQINQARKDETAKRLDYYRSNQIDYIQAEIKKHFANPEKLTPVFINLTRKIIDNLAQTYCKPAIRQIEGTERDQATYKEILNTTSMDVVMKQASKLTKLLKTTLIRVVWRNGKVELDILTGDILDVVTGDGPQDLKRIVVTHPATRTEHVTYSVWTPAKWQTLNYRGELLEEMPNPYQRLPFIALHDEMPTEDFWVEGGQDIIEAQTAINERLTDLCFALRNQAFGVGYIKSGDHGQTTGLNTVEVGPGSLVSLPTHPDAEIGFVSTKMPIEGSIKAIEFLINQTAISNSLSAHSLTTTPVNESGIAKLVGNSELMERREDDIALFRKYEHDLFDLIKAVWNSHNPGRKFSDKAALTIDFAEIKNPLADADEAEKWERLIQMGQASPIDYAIARNPDLNRETAKEYLKQIQQENGELNSASLKEAVFDFDNAA